MLNKTILAVLGGAAALTVSVIQTFKKIPRPRDPNAPVRFCAPFLDEYLGTRAHKAVDEYMKNHPNEKLTNGLFHRILSDYAKEHPDVDLFERIN